jgi:hypothetical protein
MAADADKRARVRVAQAAARAAITATLDGAVNRKKESIDLAHDLLQAMAREGLIVATAQCMAVEMASFLQLIAEDDHSFDPQEAWRLWCTAVQLPDSGT